MTIIDAIKSNVNPSNNMMKIISITLRGDGTTVFNKTNGERSAIKKVLMESELGYPPESVIKITKSTYVIGSNYSVLQNNRIKKSAKNCIVLYN
jgi:hypothetical protein